MLILTEEETGIEYVIEAYSRQQLKDMLKDSPVLISFKKVTNDRYRLLFGTRDLSRIPKSDWPTGAGLPYNPEALDLIPIYDLVKKAWRSFKVKRVRRAEKKTELFLRRLLQSKKMADRLHRRKYKRDTASPADQSVFGRDTPDGFQEAFDAGLQTIECVEIPTFLEDNMQWTLHEADNAWLKRAKDWLTRNEDKLPGVAKTAFNYFVDETDNILNIPAKLNIDREVMVDYIRKVLRGEAVSKEEASNAAQSIRDFLRFIGLGAIAFFPTPPGGSVLSIGLLRLIEKMTGLPIFPRSWAVPRDEVKQRLRFRQKVEEMASGPIGGGASTKNTEEGFKVGVTSALRRANVLLSSGQEPRRLGKTPGGVAYMIGDDVIGEILVFSRSGPFHELVNDPASVVFMAQFFQEDAFDFGRVPVITIQAPTTKPNMTGLGVAFEVYKLMGMEYDVLADNTQSKEGRYLWAKLIRDEAFKFVYVVNELSDDIESEISGNLDEFRRLMAEADDEIRFVGSNRKVDIAF